MRRKDREITDINEILAIVEKCDACRLALVDGDRPYIVPLNYGWEFDAGVLKLYFHSAKEGKKLDVMRRNPAVCFELDTSHRLVEGEGATDYTMEYESVIGSGAAEFITDIDEKRRGLGILMKHYAPDRRFEITAEQAEPVEIYRVASRDFSGKRLKKSK